MYALKAIFKRGNCKEGQIVSTLWKLCQWGPVSLPTMISPQGRAECCGCEGKNSVLKHSNESCCDF